MSEHIIETEMFGDTAFVTIPPKEPKEEIVRCRDCSLCVKKGYRLYCDRDAGGFPEVEPDCFCAWGERRESE